MADQFDKIDREILAAVEADGRITVTALAERVGLSKSPCQARLKRLEEQGIILGYRALLNVEALGRAHVAFVEVKLRQTTEAALSAFNKAVRAVPEVEQCHMIAGGYDYLLKVRTKDIAAYRQVLAETIGSLPHVAQTSTYVSMQAVKESGPV